VEFVFIIFVSGVVPLSEALNCSGFQRVLLVVSCMVR
jgi:hypothetical protein